MGYNNETYASAWQVIRKRKEQSRAEFEKNWEIALKKLPQLEEISLEMSRTGAGITMAVLSAPEKAEKHIDELRHANESLQKERAQLLESVGLPQDFLKLKHYCDKCQDTGYTGTRPCTCFDILVRQAAFAGLSHAIDGGRYSFENFSLSLYSDSKSDEGVIPLGRMREIFEYTKYYSENFDKNSQSLLLIGRTGLGKTHLSIAMAGRIVERGYQIIYTPVQRLMDKLESLKFSYEQKDKVEYAGTMSSVLECDGLILDDLGTEFITSFTGSALYNIVNSRMAEGRPTIINTNLNLGEIESTYSQRMASRIGFGYKILKFCGDDIRYVKRTGIKP